MTGLKISTPRPRTLAIIAYVLIILSLLANVRLYANIEYPMRSNAGLATAAICAIQKWGLRYIDEWVDYHLAIGFETIFIYDNSEDFETLGKLFARVLHTKENQVTLQLYSEIISTIHSIF